MGKRQNKKKNKKSEEEAKSNKKPSWKDSLYVNGGEGLEQALLWLPLFLGAWLPSGVIMAQPERFTVGLILLALVRFTVPAYINRDSAEHTFPWYALGLSGTGIGTLLVASRYQDPVFIPLLVGLLILFAAYYSLSANTIVSSVLRACSVIAISVLAWVYGIYSQLELGSESFFSEYLLLGWMSGTPLAVRSMLLARNLFIEKGWVFEREIENGKKRPGNFTQLLLLLLILGPVTPALLLPFSVLPSTFLVVSVVFYFIPKIAERIQSQEENIARTLVDTLHLVLLIEIIVFGAALLA